MSSSESADLLRFPPRSGSDFTWQPFQCGVFLGMSLLCGCVETRKGASCSLWFCFTFSRIMSILLYLFQLWRLGRRCYLLWGGENREPKRIGMEIGHHSCGFVFVEILGDFRLYWGDFRFGGLFSIMKRGRLLPFVALAAAKTKLDDSNDGV